MTISVGIEIARGDLKAEDEAARKYQMSWTWADHAFAKQVRIENWPDSMAADRRFPKQGFQQTAFSTSDLKEIIPPLEKAQGNPKYTNNSAVKVEKCLRVVEWTEGKFGFTMHANLSN
jgi:hypothetical protein